MLSVDRRGSLPAAASAVALSAARDPLVGAGSGSGGLAARLAVLTLHWPVVWALLLLVLPTLGRAWPDSSTALSVAAVVRLAALAPLLLALPAGRLTGWPWLLVVGLAGWAGALSAGELARRPAATAPTLLAPSHWHEATGLGQLRVTARPRQDERGRWSAPARILAWQGDPTPGDGPVPPRAGEGVMLRADGPPPVLGAVVGGYWRLRPPRRAPVAGGFDEAGWLQGRQIHWTGGRQDDRAEPRQAVAGAAARAGRVQGFLQEDLRGRLARGLPPREASLAGAVLLGGGVQSHLREPFVRLGLAHLFALSGLHVGIVSGLLLVVLAPVARTDAHKLALMVPALGAYTVLVDAPDSVVRAAGLVLLGLTLKVAGRAVDGLRLLGLLLWLNLLWQPTSLLDVGLRLSYLAAGGIVLGQRLLGPRLRTWRPPWRWLGAALTVSLSAQLATLPVLAESFGVLPLIGPLVNVVAVPVFGIAATCLGAGLLLSVVWPWAGQGLLACGWLVLRPLQAAAAAGEQVRWLERGLPPWGLERWLLYAGLAGLLVIVLARARGRRLCLVPVLIVTLGLVAGAGPRWTRQGPAAHTEAWQFAVGQGDCALIRLPDGWTCLVDTGGRWFGGGSNLGRDVVPYLRRLNLRRLDAVVLTHGHADHTGGADDLARVLRTGAWLVAGSAAPPAGATTVVRPVAGDTLHAAGRWALICVHPPGPDWHAPNENDHSLSLALCHDEEVVALWTGDLEGPGERVMLDHLPPVPRDGLPFWKAGHHGSRTSGTEPLLRAVRPQLVAISCGVANRHRHPSHASFGQARLVRLDLQQTLHLRWDRAGRLAWHALQPLPPGLPAAPP
jgi:competence protein ComEC